MSAAKLTVGKQAATGALVHIENAERGLACNLSCPKCGTPLVARKGKKTAHHFAHHSSEECAGAWETALHMYAKQVLAETLEIALPAIIIERAHRVTVEVQQATTYAFDALDIERNLGSFQPDALVTSPHQLCIEFAVTHFSDEAKIEKIRCSGISAVELDISGASFELSKAELDHFILHEAPRSWLFSVKQQAALKRILSEERRNAKKAAELEILRAKDERNRYLLELARQFLRLQQIASSGFIDPAAFFPRHWNPIHSVKNSPLSIDGFAPSSPELFEVEPYVWQSAIMDTFVLKPIREHKGLTTRFDCETVFWWLNKRGFLSDLFSNRFDTAYLMDYANSFGPFGRGPYTDTLGFLHHLVAKKVLWQDPHCGFKLNKYHLPLRDYQLRLFP